MASVAGSELSTRQTDGSFCDERSIAVVNAARLVISGLYTACFSAATDQRSIPFKQAWSAVCARIGALTNEEMIDVIAADCERFQQAEIAYVASQYIADLVQKPVEVRTPLVSSFVREIYREAVAHDDFSHHGTMSYNDKRCFAQDICRGVLNRILKDKWRAIELEPSDSASVVASVGRLAAMAIEGNPQQQARNESSTMLQRFLTDASVALAPAAPAPQPSPPHPTPAPSECEVRSVVVASSPDAEAEADVITVDSAAPPSGGVSRTASVAIHHPPPSEADEADYDDDDENDPPASALG